MPQPPQASDRHDPYAVLARAIRHDDFTLLSGDVLQRSTLAPYAYRSLPDEHPHKRVAKRELLSMMGRHQKIKHELSVLVRACRSAGVALLFMKGFHLAEFVYDHPGGRFHGDVDLLVHPQDVGTLQDLAVALGWQLLDSQEDFLWPYNHEACHFYSPGGSVRLDVHWLAIHSRTPFNRVQRRVTRAIWAAAEAHAWEGTVVHCPGAEDAALLLILNRCWADGWNVKLHDFLDLRLLSDKQGLTRESLLARARELRCERTVDLFLRRCDPWRGVLSLSLSTMQQRGRWSLAVAHERVPQSLELLLRKVVTAPALLLDVLGALPVIYRNVKLLKAHSNLNELFLATEPTSPVAPAPARATLEVHRTARGVRWGIRALGPFLKQQPAGLCLIRSLTLLRLLRAKGYPAVFVSGVRKSGASLEGHAWVELQGRPLLGFGDEQANTLYTVNYRYPLEGQGGTPHAERAELQAS